MKTNYIPVQQTCSWCRGPYNGPTGPLYFCGACSKERLTYAYLSHSDSVSVTEGAYTIGWPLKLMMHTYERRILSSLRRIQKYAQSGKSWHNHPFGRIHVDTHPTQPWILLCYKKEVFDWNEYEEVCRGLILHKDTGEVIAYPYNKFYNWGEKIKNPYDPNAVRETHTTIESVHEKIDGSLGIAFWYENDWHLSTKGRFGSRQAIHGQQRLREAMKEIKKKVNPLFFEKLKEFTLILEIVYPKNQIVTSYGDEDTLYILGARHIKSDVYPIVESDKLAYLADLVPHVFKLPKTYSYTHEELVDYCYTHTGDNEGFVVVYSNRERYKFKTKQYLRFAKIVKGGNTWKNAVTWFQDNKLSDLMRQTTPSHREQLKVYEKLINNSINELLRIQEYTVADIQRKVRDKYKEGTDEGKAFASYVKQCHPHIQHMLYSYKNKHTDYLDKQITNWLLSFSVYEDEGTLEYEIKKQLEVIREGSHVR